MVTEVRAVVAWGRQNGESDCKRDTGEFGEEGDRSVLYLYSEAS